MGHGPRRYSRIGAHDQPRVLPKHEGRNREIHQARELAEDACGLLNGRNSRSAGHRLDGYR